MVHGAPDQQDRDDPERRDRPAFHSLAKPPAAFVPIVRTRLQSAGVRAATRGRSGKRWAGHLRLCFSSLEEDLHIDARIGG
jgi:hypothetical protein